MTDTHAATAVREYADAFDNSDLKAHDLRLRVARLGRGFDARLV